MAKLRDIWAGQKAFFVSHRRQVAIFGDLVKRKIWKSPAPKNKNDGAREEEGHRRSLSASGQGGGEAFRIPVGL